MSAEHERVFLEPEASDQPTVLEAFVIEVITGAKSKDNLAHFIKQHLRTVPIKDR